MGPTGPKGDQGETGPKGDKGDKGDQGETGPSGNSDTFMHIYNTGVQLVPVESDFKFDSNNIIIGSCGHIVGSPDIYIWKAGYYHMVYSIFHLEPMQMAIFKNNVKLIGSNTGDQIPSTSAVNSIIFVVTPQDLTEQTPLSPTGLAARINLRNHSSFVPVTINGHAGIGTQVLQNNIDLTLFLLRHL
jgi:hypothetical protein